MKSRFDSHYCADRHNASAYFNFFSTSLKIEKIQRNKFGLPCLIKSYDFPEAGKLTLETCDFLDELGIEKDKTHVLSLNLRRLAGGGLLDGLRKCFGHDVHDV